MKAILNQNLFRVDNFYQGYAVVSDEKPNKGDFVLYNENGKYHVSNNRIEDGDKKIIATINFTLLAIPYVDLIMNDCPEYIEIMKNIQKEYGKNSSEMFKFSTGSISFGKNIPEMIEYLNGFISGYKKAIERFKYQIGDMEYAFECATDSNPSYESFSDFMNANYHNDIQQIEFHDEKEFDITHFGGRLVVKNIIWA